MCRPHRENTYKKTLSLIFSQFMFLMAILEKMNKMIPYNQVTNHFLGKLG